MKQLEKIRNLIAENNLDGVFIHQPENILYLSGFSGTLAGIWLTEKNAYILVDSRYEEQAKEQCPNWNVVLSPSPWLIKPLLQGEKVIGFEENFLTVATFEALKAELPLNAELVPKSEEIAALRMIKEPEELEILQKAVDIADDAFRHILPFIKEGVLEIEISNELDFFMRSQGATAPSFDFIVASGPRSALPHGVAGNNKILAHEPLLMDYGCIYENYCSDMTRTVFLGEPEPEMRQLYHVVKEGQARAYAKAFPGLKISNAEKATRDYFAEFELENYFGHSLGHGVGLEIHELPTVNKKNDMVFKPNMVFTLEPGIYIPQAGGVRIEDMVRMTPSGAFTMTASPKDLIVL
ncbi:MAG: Xaa-Pro peptidase family protein [Clostridiales bacterium]